jgi:hypothetical protein
VTRIRAIVIAAVAATAAAGLPAVAAGTGGHAGTATAGKKGGPCAARNPGKQPTDVDDMIGQDPDRVTQGLNLYITADTDPNAPGVHVENWGRQWFTDARKTKKGVRVTSTMVGGTTGDRYWVVTASAGNGASGCVCPPQALPAECVGSGAGVPATARDDHDVYRR